MVGSQFARTQALIGEDGFSRLSKALFVVAGIGAVGSYAAESLVRAGAHNIRIVDFDVISESNINRQLFALYSTIGKLKVDTAKERLLDINPDCNIDSRELFIRHDTVKEVIADEPAIIIDAIDSLNPKVALIKKAYENKIPVICSMGAAMRRDPAKIAVADLFKTRNCPLAKHVRKRLRKFGVGKGISCVYSYEDLPENYKESFMPEDKTPCSGNGRTRNALGSISTITGIFGLWLANMAINRVVAEKS